MPFQTTLPPRPPSPPPPKLPYCLYPPMVLTLKLSLFSTKSKFKNIFPKMVLALRFEKKTLVFMF